MKRKSVLWLPFVAAISVVCFPRQALGQQLLLEAFPEKAYMGNPSRVTQLPAPLNKPRSIKIYTNSVLAFGVDSGFVNEGFANAGVLISRGQTEVADLGALPKRSQDGLGNVGPSGNFDQDIVMVRQGSLPQGPNDDWGNCPGSNDSVYTVIGCPPPPHRMTDAECHTSDSPSHNQAVYRIRLSSDSNTCLGYDAGDVTKVPKLDCSRTQEKMFTFIPAQNGCWVIRNGNTAVPPVTGRCLYVDHEDTGDGSDNTDEVGAGICAPTDQERWKLIIRDGKYNLINQRSGKCLSAAGDDARALGCDPQRDSRQLWDIVYERAQ